MTTYYITAGINVEAAVVDGIGDVAGSGQFIGICTSRSNHLTGRVTIVTITYIQCSSIGRYSISSAAGSRIHGRCNANTVAGCYLAGSSSLSSFQLIFSCTTTAGDVVRIPGLVSQTSYSAVSTVNLNRVTTGGRAYGDAVGQLEADLVVGDGGDDVTVTFVGNCLSQFNGVRCAVVGSNLEAVFFQIVQLSAIDGFFATRSNVAIRYVTQGNRFVCITTYQVHFVARVAGGDSCIVNVSHRSIEFNFGYAVVGVDFGYGALAINKVDGIAVGHEVFVLTVTLYGEAGVQYVINGGGIIAFVTSSQGSTIVAVRVTCSSSSISQVALHIGQGGRGGSAAVCILHAGNHVASSNFVTACRRIIELAVRSFVHLRTVSFGVYHRGLGVLYYSLSIQSVGVGLITIGSIHILFHSQTVTCGEGYFLAGFNGGSGSSSTASQITASCGLEAAVVDGISNVTGSGQFVSISRNRGNHFASWVAVVTITYFQRCSGYGLRSNLTRYSLQLSNVYYISIFLTCSYPRNLASNIICNIAYRYCCFSRSPSSVIFSCNCIQRISSFHTSSGRSNGLITHSNSTIYGCFGVRT